MTGPDHYERYVARHRGAFGDLELIVADLTVADETVVIQTSGRGTQESHDRNRDPTGNGSTLTGLEIVHVEDGTVTG